MSEASDEGQRPGETCDECSPCWPHRGGYGFCECECHPADPVADFDHAMLVIEHLRGQNEVMRQVLDSLDSTTRMGGLTGKTPFDVGFIWCQNQEALLAGETTWAAQFGTSGQGVG